MTKLNITAEPGTPHIMMSREFDAPRELVFRAFTDPSLVPQWWGPHRLTTVVDKMDVQMGGIWRFVQHDAAGNEFAFHGVYHDVSAPERMIYTFEFEGMPGHVLLETITFDDCDGRTCITDSLVFQTVADRDGMLQSGMEQGAAESMDRLEAHLRTL